MEQHSQSKSVKSPEGLQQAITEFWCALKEQTKPETFHSLERREWGASFLLRQDCRFALFERNGQLVCKEYESLEQDHASAPVVEENDYLWGEYDGGVRSCFQDFIDDWNAHGEE